MPEFVALDALVRSTAERLPHKTAVIDADRTIDYADFNALIDRIAATVQASGLKPQDTISICALSSIEYAATFLGALRAGIAVAPLAPSSKPTDFAAMVKDAAAKILFLDNSTADSFATADIDPAISRVALDGGKAGKAFKDWLVPEGSKPQPVTIEPDWVFNIIYSSGTTGTPKGIVHTMGMRWRQYGQLDPLGYGREAVTVLSTPLYSNTTLVCFNPTFAGGGTLVLMKKFDARGFLELSAKHRATHAMLVPVQYRRIMAVEDFDSFDLSSFVMKYSTSAPFAAALKADVLKRWPGALIEIYGMTEGGAATLLLAHQYPDKLHTVGQPAPGNEIRLIDEEGREVAQGGVGEVVGRGPAMMTGYHNRAEASAAAEWFDAEGRRYIRHGDIGRFDEDGFLILMDRAKDMIISGGFNIYPSDLEAVLRAEPGITDAAVVGVPHPDWGETPVGFVVGDETLDLAALLASVNARLGKTQRLSALHAIDELPRSAIGKVLKRELRDRLA